MLLERTAAGFSIILVLCAGARGADHRVVLSAQVQVSAQSSVASQNYQARSQLTYTMQVDKTWPVSWDDKVILDLVKTVPFSDLRISTNGSGSQSDPDHDANWNWTYSIPQLTLDPSLPGAYVAFYFGSFPGAEAPPFCMVAFPTDEFLNEMEVRGVPGADPTSLFTYISDAFRQAKDENYGADTDGGFFESPPPENLGPWSTTRQYSLDYTPPGLTCDSGACKTASVHISIRYYASVDVPQPTVTISDDDPCQTAGSIIGARNQSLAQELPIAGTPFTLRYQSNRMPPASPAALGLGGWSLNVQHTWDPMMKVLYRGDGSLRSGSDVKTVPAGDGGFALPSTRENLVYQFDKNNHHIRTLNELTGSVVWEFQYDDIGRVISVKDGYGNLTQINHRGAASDAEDLAAMGPSSIFAPYGQITLLSTDDMGHLSQVTAPDGSITRMTYDPMGHMQTFTDANGNIHRFTYDFAGLLARDDDPAGGFQTLQRNNGASGNAVQRTTASGRVTTYQAAGDPGGSTTAQSTFADGTGASGLKTGSLPSSVQDSVGASYQIGWTPDPRWGAQDAFPSALSLTTPSGIVSKVVFDHASDASASSDPLTPSSSHEVLTVNGRPYTQDYSAPLRTFKRTSPASRISTRSLDANGNVVKLTYPGLAPWQYAYDTHGRLSSITWGEGADARTKRYDYSPDGFVSRFTGSLGKSVSIQRDKVGRILSATLPDGGVATFSYDSNGNLTTLFPPGRSAHKFQYTSLDQISSYTPPAVPGTGSTQFAWNTDREVAQLAQPGSGAIKISYNQGGQLTRLDFDGGNIVFGYDNQTGQVASATDAAGNSVSHVYDGPLRSSDTWSGTVHGTVQRTFDSDLRVASVAAAGSNPVSVGYDQDGYITSIGDLSVTRDPGSALPEGAALGNIGDALTYNTFGELTAYRVSGPTGNLYSFTLTRDRAGRITGNTETIDGKTNSYEYDYDAMGRLAGVQSGGAQVTQYKYDANGNRLRVTTATGSEDAAYDAQDRLTLRGAAAYGYTANGDTAQKTIGGNTTQYGYDGLGHLQRVLLPSGEEIRYVFDGEGHRIGKILNGALVQGFLYSSNGQPAAELDGRNNLVSLFFYIDTSGAPAYMIKAGVKYGIFTDPSGSVRLVVNASTGEVAQRIDYDAFGKVLADSSPGFQPFGFAGGLYDPATGLVHFMAREYDPESGRWTSKDPFGFGGGELNVYAYSGDDPINRSDPGGLYDWHFPRSAADLSNEWNQAQKGVKDWVKEECESATGKMSEAWEYLTKMKGDEAGKNVTADPIGEYGKAHEAPKEGEKGTKDLKKELKEVVDEVNNNLCEDCAVERKRRRKPESQKVTPSGKRSEDNNTASKIRQWDGTKNPQPTPPSTPPANPLPRSFSNPNRWEM